MGRPNPSDRIERVARELKAPAGSSTLFANEEAISKNRRAFVMEVSQDVEEIARRSR